MNYVKNHERICQIKRKNLHCYLIDDCSVDKKKAKGTKKCAMKRKLKFEDKNCLEATQLEIKINHLGKNKTDADSLEKDHKEFIRIHKFKRQLYI